MNDLAGMAPWLSALLWASLYASLLALAVLALQPLLRRHLPARWRFALWMLVLLRFAPLPLPPSPLSIFNWLPRHQTPAITASPAVPQIPPAYAPMTARPGIAAPITPPVAVSSNPISSPPPTAVPPAPAPIPVASPTPAPPTSARTLVTPARLLNSLYLLGVTAVFARLLLATMALRRIVRRASLVHDPAILNLLDEARRTIALRRTIPLHATDQLTSPALVGLWHPQLLLPRPLLALLSAGELRLVFLHEAAHIRRRDVLANYALALLEIAHWFNPLVWFILPRLRAERELACDELVLRHTADPAPYGHTLLKLFEFAQPARSLAPAVGIIETRSFIARRIHTIANYRPRRAWLALPVAVAVLLVAGFLLTSPASQGQSLPATTVASTQAPAATLKADEGYKGWVHMSYGKDDNGKDGNTVHWNTQTHASATCYPTNGYTVTDNAKPNDLATKRVIYRDPQTGATFDYLASTGLIRIGNYLPELRPGDAHEDTPINFPDLLDKLRAVAGKDAVKFTQSTDRGLDRFDITITKSKPAAAWPPEEFDAGAGALGRPSTVWVDPKTKLISAVLLNGKEITLTYGAPEIHSIYDAGAPQDAKIYDNRPTPEAMAVVQRIRARIDKPLPDGVMVRFVVSSDISVADQLQVYGKAGDQWAIRWYSLASKGRNGGGLAAAGWSKSLQMPDHWQDTAADELFRRLAVTMPEDETGGDGTKGWVGEFDPDTGEQYITYASMVEDEKGKTTTTSEGKVAGRQEYTGEQARNTALIESPTQWFYPENTHAAFSTDNHLDLITSPDRPGEVALRVLFPDQTPGSLRFMTQEWIDPAHDDRAVSFQALGFINPKVRQVQDRNVKQFGQYATLPAPDGRSYPTLWTETTYDAEGNVLYGGPTVTELHFFPGRRLPDIPKKSPRP